MWSDELSKYYSDLLDGSYNCVDRLVLNGYCSLCHSAGGFRTWWRRLHNGSDEELDENHLMRMAGRFLSFWSEDFSLTIQAARRSRTF